MAVEIIELASKIYEQDNTLTVRWVLGRGGVPGSEIANTPAKKAAMEKTPDNESRKAMGRVGASFLRRKAVGQATKQWGGHFLELNSDCPVPQ